MRILPVNRKRLVHLHVLASLNASAAKNALLRVVAVEGVRVVFFVGLGMKGNWLVLDAQQFFRVVDSAVSVVIIADRAVENVIGENAVERFSLRSAGVLGVCKNLHPGGHCRGARSHEFPIGLYHAGVTRLDRTKLRVIADLRKLHPRSIDDINQALTAHRFLNFTIDR
jgi:hypothetical protein